MRLFRDYSNCSPKVRRIMMIRDVFITVGLLAVILALILHLCGLHTAEELILDIIRTAILIIVVVSVPILGGFVSVRAFREKRIGTGIFLALMSLTIPTVILLAVTEKGRALVLYILEGY
ncbi:MAG: hypothetical protein HDT21_07275 [Ruminococcus sp.]|nr:hypothetical protein [Ruminococcus sp.]